ncbi:unnamed protein product [marine sediment metagenome]|uniref:Uncharacterized protein n=1 Tax=marine sediment metagenome TaxID=412755 RepID=X1KV29_9ZZZZ
MGKEGKGKEEEGWFYFTTRMDSRGRLSVPPDDRENMGIYKTAAQVAVKMKVLKLYEAAAENG